MDKTLSIRKEATNPDIYTLSVDDGPAITIEQVKDGGTALRAWGDGYVLAHRTSESIVFTEDPHQLLATGEYDILWQS